MADVLITYEAMDTAAKNVETARTNLDDVTKFLDGAVKALDGVWVGETQKAFVEAWQQSKPTMQKLAEAVAKYAPELRSFADKMKTADTGNKFTTF